MPGHVGSPPVAEVVTEAPGVLVDEDGVMYELAGDKDE
jgi:hypothetical protein